MGSTTPCPNHFAHSFSREALDAHELTCPTVTHALVPQLYEALDPEFLVRRVRRRTFNVAIFETLGEAMKVHCAPIRDAMVDDMVATALSPSTASISAISSVNQMNPKQLAVGNVALALRKCFDCVEVMKLVSTRFRSTLQIAVHGMHSTQGCMLIAQDIANHQVHALRPYLWTCAPQYEIANFNSLLVQTNTPIVHSQMRDWIRAASLSVLSLAQPAARTHLIGQCPCANRGELVLRSVALGFTRLAFSKWPVAAWPPLTHKRLTAMGMIPAYEPQPTGIDVPESLRMDARRIKAFKCMLSAFPLHSS